MKYNNLRKDLLKSIAYGKFSPGQVEDKLTGEKDIKKMTDAQLLEIVRQDCIDRPDHTLNPNDPDDREMLDIRAQLRGPLSYPDDNLQ